jgi:hypothetical protein
MSKLTDYFKSFPDDIRDLKEQLELLPTERQIPAWVIVVGLLLILLGNFLRFWFSQKELGDTINVIAWTLIGLGFVLMILLPLKINDASRLTALPAVEEEIRKSKRLRQEYEDEISRLPADRANRVQQLRNRIYRIDLRLIELNARRTSLAHMEADSEHKSDLFHLDDDELTGMRTKRDLVSKLGVVPKLDQQRSSSELIAEQEDVIEHLERDRDQELSTILNRSTVERFEDLPPAHQDRYMEADNSWEAKLQNQREKLRELKQSRRAAR